jgi:hypothetical protein
MRANFDAGISGVACSSGPAGISASSSWRTTGRGAEVASTRGLRVAGSADDGESETDGSLPGCFGAKSASAACRALVIRSRSSPRGCGRSHRSGKNCSAGLVARDIENESRRFSQVELGKPEASPQPRSPQAPPAPLKIPITSIPENRGLTQTVIFLRPLPSFCERRVEIRVASIFAPKQAPSWAVVCPCRPSRAQECRVPPVLSATTESSIQIPTAHGRCKPYQLVSAAKY